MSEHPIPERWRDYYLGRGCIRAKLIEELGAAEAKNRELVKALEAFVEAFKEPDGGDNRPLRKVAESYGIYADDLGRDRILLRIANTVLKANEVQP